jgi:hypothetical protein
MTNDFTRQAEEFFKSAQDARIPETLRTLATDSVAKSHQAYSQLTAVAASNAKATEEVLLTAVAGAKSLTEKAVAHATHNAEMAFDMAGKVARAQSLPEVAQLQADFMRTQMDTAGLQIREFFDLATRVAQSTLQTSQKAANVAASSAKISI